MSALKSVIITLPAKSLAKAPVVASAKTTTAKINFATPVLLDKIKLEDPRRMQQAVKHMEFAPATPEAVAFKQENGAPAVVRGKKRRLDHLTWEEKLQRKKLKNRVAAQTSRDRKKAKLDELEDSVRELRESNDELVAECTNLRTQNESLIMELKQLKQERELEVERKKLDDKEKNNNNNGTNMCSMCQARVDCAAPTLGSAAGWRSTEGTSSDNEPERRVLHNPEDPDSLPPLEDLFSELQGHDDEYIDRLEELAESLMREVAAEMETHSPCPDQQNANEKESTGEFIDTEAMVGQASSYVEAGKTGESIATEQPSQEAQVSSIPELSVLPSVIPTVTLNASGPVEIDDNVVEIKEEPRLETEIVYGTYDEATNCITIIYPEEEMTHLTTNQLQQQPQQQQLLSPTYSYDSMSPASVHSEDTDVTMTPVTNKLLDYVQSDAGYESHGSPESSASGALTDLWQESFRELFPSLA